MRFEGASTAHLIAQVGSTQRSAHAQRAALTEELPVPTIGIGASPKCDGQILVIDDILGVFQDFTPRFVKRYADLADQISDAAATYADEVRRGLFPTPEHTFGGKPKPAGTGTGTGG